MSIINKVNDKYLSRLIVKKFEDYLDGKIYHFRDNVTGLEVDTVLEFSSGEYALCEIKLSCNSEVIDSAKKSLLKFCDNVKEKPKFMCIITANFGAVHRDEETGIYILPITSLMP